jgi:type IV pilus assembly protein PilM
MENVTQATPMALFPQSVSARRRTQLIAIDLGMRTTKAVSLQRRGSDLELLRYSIQDAPIHEKDLSTELLAQHLKNVMEALGAKTKQVIVVAGVNDCLLRHAEMPLVPIGDMRMMLKFNSKTYLQQDLTDYVFDCHILPPRAGAKPPEGLKANQKCRVLVGGAKRQFVDSLQAASKEAGLAADHIAPSLMATANAFELAQPELFNKEVVALVDIGFRNSSISILLQGELTLSRVVGFGGDKLTAGLAEALNISYAEAEGIKIGMPEQVQSTMLPLLTPLGRELRASIDFFEHQQDKAVSQVFVSGGSARSPFIIEALQSELMVPCKSWNPLSFLTLSLPPQQRSELEQVAPQLAVAAGGAVADF